MLCLWLFVWYANLSAQVPGYSWCGNHLPYGSAPTISILAVRKK